MYKVSLSWDDPKSTILPKVTDGRKDERTDKASYRVASLLKNVVTDKKNWLFNWMKNSTSRSIDMNKVLGKFTLIY